MGSNFKFLSKYLKISVMGMVLMFIMMACVDSEFDYELEYAGDRIVILGYINNEGNTHLLIKKSLHPQNPNGDDLIINATVDLYEDNVMLTSLTELDSGRFFLPLGMPLTPGRSYHVYATAPNLPDAWSRPQVLPNIVCFDTVYYAPFEIEPYKFLSKFCISDPVDVQNYYYTKRKSFLNGVESTGFNAYYDAIPYSNIITEDLIQQGSTYCGIEGLYPYSTTDSVAIELLNLTRDMYEFGLSYDQYDFTRGDAFLNIMPIYSNIENGYGFFGIYSSCWDGYPVP